MRRTQEEECANRVIPPQKVGHSRSVQPRLRGIFGGGEEYDLHIPFLPLLQPL